MKVLLFALVSFFTISLIHAQNCEAYVPFDEGTELTYTNFNAKGKKENDTKQKLISKTSEAGAVVYKMRQEIIQEKKDPIVSELKYKCLGNRFIFDMKSFVSEDQMKSTGNTKLDITFDEIDIPSGAAPGTKLKDGSITMKIQSEAPINLTFKTLITDRKIETIESVTTPAGTFECIKISQNITTNTGMIKVTVKSVSWMAKNIGTIKSETYSKDSKLLSSMVLQKVTK